MKPSARHIVSFILLIAALVAAGVCLFFQIASTEYKNFKIGESLALKLQYVLEIKNDDSRNPAKIVVSIPEIPQLPPLQTSKLIWLSSKPGRTYTDKNNNKIFDYTLDIPPNAEKKISFIYILRTYDVTFSVNVPNARADAFKEFTRHENYIESAHPLIIQKAKDINRQEDNPYYEALNNYDYIREKYKFDLTRKPKSALGALTSPVLQCLDSTLLYMSFCRSLGIPSRLFGGVYFWDSKRTGYAETHSWSRIYLGRKNGWVTVDPTQGRFDGFTRFSNFAQNTAKHIYLWQDDIAPYRIYAAGAGASPAHISSKLCFEIKQIRQDGPSKAPEKRYPEIKNANTASDSKDAFKRALARLEDGSYESSAKQFVNIIKRLPASPAAYEGFIISCYYAGKISYCAGAYYPMLSRGKDNPLYLYLTGMSLVYDNKYSLAEKHLNELLKTNFDKSYASSALGQLYERTKQIDKALASYKKALDLNPDYLFARIHLFKLYFDLHDWRSIIHYAEQDENYYKNNGFFPLYIGCAYLNEKQYEKAIPYLKISCDTTRLLGSPHILLGIAYKELKQYKLARQEIAKGIALGKGIGDAEFFKNILKYLDGQIK